MMGILTQPLLRALSIHIFLTFYLLLLPSLYPYCRTGFATREDEIAEKCMKEMKNRGWNEATQKKKMAIELNNGRAAQMGILGLMVSLTTHYVQLSMMAMMMMMMNILTSPSSLLLSLSIHILLTFHLLLLPSLSHYTSL